MMIKTPHSICLLRLTSLGDIVLLTPMIRALRNAWPSTRFDMIVSSHCADVIQHNPHIDNLHIISTKQGTLGFLIDWIALKKTLPKFDLAIDVHDSLRTRLMRINLANKVLIYDSARSYKRSIVNDKKRIPIERITPVPHRYFTALKDIPSITPDDLGLEFWLAHESEQGLYSAKSAIDSGSVILISPGAKHATKRWPPAYVATLISMIRSVTDMPIQLIGGIDDKSICDEIQSISSIPISNLAGSLTLEQLASYMDTAACVIGNDSGLMHIAAARHVPVLTIFGSTVPEFGFLPYHTQHEIVSIELPCKPCTHIGNAKCPEGHFSCMKLATPSIVFERFKSLLAQRANRY